MAYDSDVQFFHRMIGKSPYNEFGNLAFTTTGLTVEIPLGHICSNVHSFTMTPISKPAQGETYYCDQVITSQAITLTRKTEPFMISNSTCDEALYVSGNDWVAIPIGVAPVAGLITGFAVKQITRSTGGTFQHWSIGKQTNEVVLVDNAGATDGFVVGGLVTQATSLARGIVTAWDNDAGAMTPGTLTIRSLEGLWATGAITMVDPAGDGVLTPDTHVPAAASKEFFLDDGNAFLAGENGFHSYITKNDFDNEAGLMDAVAVAVGDSATNITSRTVAAGDLIIIGTTNGGTADPSGVMAQIEIMPTPTSGLEFSYDVKGR